MNKLSLGQIGKRRRQVQSQTEFTREQFAEQSGISPQFLAEIKTGKANTGINIAQTILLLLLTIIMPGNLLTPIPKKNSYDCDVEQV